MLCAKTNTASSNAWVEKKKFALMKYILGSIMHPEYPKCISTISLQYLQSEAILVIEPWHCFSPVLQHMDLKCNQPCFMHRKEVLRMIDHLVRTGPITEGWQIVHRNRWATICNCIPTKYVVQVDLFPGMCKTEGGQFVPYTEEI